MADELKPIRPEEIAFGEADGAVSINAEAVAERLNVMLAAIERLQRTAERGCDCMNCVVIGVRR